jgi:hypothetical protein
MLMVDEVGSLCVAGVMFEDLGAGSFMGFHDWLREGISPSRVIGLRFTPTDPESLAMATFERAPYVTKRGEGIEIYFAEDKIYNPAISDDQSFQYSKIMRAPTGDIALVVDIASLSDREIEQIEKVVSRSPKD